MNYGLYLSAAGTLTSLHRQDVLANNLANINTVGFKPDSLALVSRLPERMEAMDPSIEAQALLEQLGGGQFSGPTRITLRQGTLTQSGNDLDLAIQGDGFFVVDSGRDASGRTRGRSSESLRFTRDGRFTINTAGELVMASTGMPVLDVNDQPIRLNRSATVTIDANGGIRQNGVETARLQVSSVADASKLVKHGDNLLAFGGRGVKRQGATGTVMQRHIEASAVDPIMALNAVINASKAVQANATMMQYHDNLLGQAVNTLGRVA